MTSAQARNAYRRTEKMATIHPVKLIHLMFERIIAHLDLVAEGIDEGNALKRGENLGKAIAIITELNASIKTDDQSEAATFLRGLYSAILVELPKVSARNDKAIAVKAQKYIQGLKDIWEQTAMRENGLPVSRKVEGQGELQPAKPMNMAALGNDLLETRKTAEKAAGGLSFSI